MGFFCDMCEAKTRDRLHVITISGFYLNSMDQDTELKFHLCESCAKKVEGFVKNG